MIPLSSTVPDLIRQWSDGHEPAVLNYFAKLPPYSAAALAVMVYGQMDEIQRMRFMCSLLELSGYNMVGKG